MRQSLRPGSPARQRARDEKDEIGYYSANLLSFTFALALGAQMTTRPSRTVGLEVARYGSFDRMIRVIRPLQPETPLGPIHGVFG